MLRGALVSRSVAEWIETHIVISLLLLVATALSACAGSGSAEVTATLAPTPTAHSDSPDTPPHTHAKDGLMVFTDDLPAPALVPNTIDRNELFDQLSADTERDFFMGSEAAKEYGIIDNIVTRKPSDG